MKDKSELIDEVLGKLAEDLINYDQRMIKAKAPNIRFVHKYTKEAKATLQKAFREVEIEGRKEQLMQDFNSILLDTDIKEELLIKWRLAAESRLEAELTKIKEDTSRE